MKKIGKWLFISLFILTMVGCKERTIETREIKSLYLDVNKQYQSKGSYFLMFAKYESEENIETDYYLYIMGEEGFRLQQISSERLEIVETDDIKPCIKGKFYDDGKIMDFGDYIIYVPTGTIAIEYDVSLIK